MDEQPGLSADEIELTEEDEAALDRAWATITEEEIERSIAALNDAEEQDQ